MQDPPKLETIVCPLCKSPQFNHVATRFDKFDIVRCQECKLAYLNPPPTPEQTAKMYEDGYYCGSIKKSVGYSNYSLNTASIKLNPPYAWELLLAETPLSNKRALDIGCACGQWVYWMMKEGAKATGIDLASEGVKLGRDKLGLDLRQTRLEWLDEPKESFDVITMVDFIEHIIDLDNLMTNLASLLKPGGLVFVQTPNFESYQRWGDKSIHLRFSLEHVLYFEAATLDKLFTQYGMIPTRKTRVLSAIPCDVKSFLKMREVGRSTLSSWFHHIPGFYFVHLIRSKFFEVKQAYRYDESRLEGSVIIGSYMKQKN